MKSRKISYIRQNTIKKQKSIFVILTYVTLGLLLLFFLVNGIVKSSFFIAKDLISGDIAYTIGQDIKLDGNIGNVLGNGILQFTQNDGKIWAIKSKNLNLLNYLGKAIIYGKIEGTNIDGTFMIDVTKIIQVVENKTPHGLDNKFYNMGFGLYININDPNYFVSYVSGEVIIKDVRIFKPSVKIIMWWCDNKNPDRDCQKIVNDGEKRQFDNFISSNGMKYYKMSDGSWFLDDKNGRGYLIYASSDQTMFYVTRFVYLLGRDYIKQNIENSLSTLCKDTENGLQSIDNFEIKYQNGNNFAILKGPGNIQGSYLQCEILINDSDHTKDVIYEPVNVIPINKS